MWLVLLSLMSADGLAQEPGDGAISVRGRVPELLYASPQLSVSYNRSERWGIGLYGRTYLSRGRVFLQFDEEETLTGLEIGPELRIHPWIRQPGADAVTRSGSVAMGLGIVNVQGESSTGIVLDGGGVGGYLNLGHEWGLTSGLLVTLSAGVRGSYLINPKYLNGTAEVGKEAFQIRFEPWVVTPELLVLELGWRGL